MATQAPSNGHPKLSDVLSQDIQNNGPPLHSFDPAASPEDKAAAAVGKARDKLESVLPQDHAGAREVQIQDTGRTALPTITVEDTDVDNKEPIASPPSQAAPDAQQDMSSTVPGAMPVHPVPTIPDWYRVGWRQVSGIDNNLPEGELKEKGILDTFLSEQFYGSWYHDGAVVLFAVFASHFLTRFNFGWGWLFIVLAICNTYYTTSLQRVLRRARDDIQRELVKTRLASEHESADWLNNFLDRFWLIYEPVLSASIVSSVDQVLSTNTPAFLDSIRLSHFTLGTKAPRIDKVRTFPTTPDDVVMMDWAISFTPNDISEMTPKKVAVKQNPKIILELHIGKAFATAALPILVEDITFSGLMRIRMKLMANFPHVQVLDFTFLEKPAIDYVLKPIGGETFGFDIANIPGLASFIDDMTHASLGPMMYDPNVFTLNLEQMLSGKPLDSAIGVIQVTIHSARGIKGTKIGGGTPDPYIALTFNDRAELARTKHKSNTFNPTWMETKYLLINSLDETLFLHLWDYNDHRKDSLMGFATFELSKLRDDASQEDIKSNLLSDGKEKGEVRYDLSYFPVLEPQETGEALDGSVGIVRLVIHQAKDLDHTKSMSGELNPLAKVYIGNSKTVGHTTRRLKRTLNPVWESAHEFICPDKASSIIRIDVIDDRDFLKDPVVGYMSIRLTDLLDSRGEASRDWFPLSGCKSGKIRLSAEWRSLNMPGSIQGAERYVAPIGVVRLLLDRATDVKNVEAALGGKSDPYMRVQVNNVTKARTEVVNNNLNPVWDEIVYIPVHSLKETLLLECMDYQHLTKDRSLGSVELQVSELAKESGNKGYPYDATVPKDAVEPIRTDKGSFKGELHYTATFVPAFALKAVKFDIEQGEGKAIDKGDDTSSSHSTTNGDVPIEVTIKRRSTTSLSSIRSEAKPESQNLDVEKPAPPNNADEGIEMNTEELLAQQSGIIIFNVISGTLAKKGRLEVALDDGYWPSFSTVKSRSTHAAWEYVGEAFLKEIDFSRVWLRLNEADEGEKDDIVAEWKGDTKSFLQDTLAGPRTFTLVDDQNKNLSTVRIETRYVPVPVTLEPRETINNQGVLRVDLLDGDHIYGIDRGGKSDPFAVFSLNGTRVHKSQVKKKTLSPEWNETFSVSVPSRVAADFSVEIFDWNQIEQSKSLGSAKIDLNDIEPFVSIERVLSLLSAKLGEKGHIRVRLLFHPEIIMKARKNTSTFTSATATFSTAGRAMTQIGALPVSAGKGVFHGVTGVFKKDREAEVTPEFLPPPAPPVAEARHPIASDNLDARSAAFPTPKRPAEGDLQDPGTLRVSILDARNLPIGESKAYAVIRVGDKEYKTKHVGKTSTPEWQESFFCAAGPLTPKLFLWLFDHKTLGKDKEIGEGELDIWRYVKHEGTSSAEVSVDLRQGGFVRLRLEFDGETNPLAASGSSGSIASGDRMSRTVSLTTSPSRFSIARGRRTVTDQDDE